MQKGQLHSVNSKEEGGQQACSPGPGFPSPNSATVYLVAGFLFAAPPVAGASPEIPNPTGAVEDPFLGVLGVPSLGVLGHFHWGSPRAGVPGVPDVGVPDLGDLDNAGDACGLGVGDKGDILNTGSGYRGKGRVSRCDAGGASERTVLRPVSVSGISSGLVWVM